MNCKRLADLIARLAQDTRAQLFFVWAALLLSLPPVGVCWLAFVALVPLVRQILNPERPKWLYTHLWICGTLFWLCEAHFVRYPHPVNYVLWGAMACYLGVYLPLFVSVSRVWLYRILPSLFPRLSTTTAALFVLPLTWAACDILRYWIFTGYFMSSLCHAFYLWTPFIQTADLMGEWGTTATVVFLGVCLATCVRRQDGRLRPRWTPILAAALMCAGIFSYGFWRMSQPCEAIPNTNLALLQGNIPAQLFVDEAQVRATEEQYFGLVRQAILQAQAENRPIDLLVFPESIYRHPVIFEEPNALQPPDLLDENDQPMSPEEFRYRLHAAAEFTQDNLRTFTRICGLPIITGCGVEVYSPIGVKSYNTAIYVQPQGAETVEALRDACYHKMHLVPFGEYIPFMRTLRRWKPDIVRLSPIGPGGEMGDCPVAFEIPTQSGTPVIASMNICFESAVGRLLRRQLSTLRKDGVEPQFLLNVTNNGWFKQSNETKLHLACGVFRTIENRKPLLTAANFGISSVIDSNGRILEQLPTGGTGVLLTPAYRDSLNRHTLFAYTGHLSLWFPLVFFLAGAFVGLRAKSAGTAAS